MQTPHAEQSRRRVLLLEPNTALRSAIRTVLDAEHYEISLVESLAEALHLARDEQRCVALVAWQGMQGLLSDEHHSDLIDVTRHLRLVVMVPRHWWRLLEATDVPDTVTALIAKPFAADELITTIDDAFAAELEPQSVAT